jgi:hypothetical protein
VTTGARIAASVLGAAALTASATGGAARAAWERVPIDGGPVEDMVLHRHGSKLLAAVVSQEGLWVSEDGGKAWKPDRRFDPVADCDGPMDLAAEKTGLVVRCATGPAPPPQCVLLPWGGGLPEVCRDPGAALPDPAARSKAEEALVAELAKRHRWPEKVAGVPLHAEREGRVVLVGHPLLGPLRSEDGGATFARSGAGMRGLRAIAFREEPDGSVAVTIASPLETIRARERLPMGEAGKARCRETDCALVEEPFGSDARAADPAPVPKSMTFRLADPPPGVVYDLWPRITTGTPRLAATSEGLYVWKARVGH